MRRLLALVLLAAGVACVACQPLPPTYPVPSPTGGGSTEAPLVVGDSITWQALLGGGFSTHPTWETHMAMGWKMSDVDDRIIAERDAGTLDTLVVALGTNDANPTWNGGWTTADENLWASVLMNLHADTRVVLVLPWLTEPADPVHRTEIDEARAWMITLAGLRARTVTVDWQPYTVLPNVIHTDGIHLAPTGDDMGNPLPEAIAARIGVLEAGVEAVGAY